MKRKLEIEIVTRIMTGNSRLMFVEGDQLEGIIALKDMLTLLSLKKELNDLEKK
jgi:hypothetical protein